VNKYFEEHKHEFFTYNGAKYYFGTKFKMKIKHEYGFDQIVNAVFKGYNNDKLVICYNTPLDEAENYKFKSGMWLRNGIHMTDEKLQESIIEILPGNYEIEMETRKKYWKDTDDPNLMAKWGMYIFFMIWVCLLKGGFIWGQICVSIIFFAWRHKYKEENCVYYE
jgi:hypothetical protein